VFDINIAIGRVGKDPELRRTKSGAPVVHFRLATNERVSDGSGETRTETEWHNIVIWGKLAETAIEYVKKGRLMVVVGNKKTESYEVNGAKRESTYIKAWKYRMLDHDMK